MKTIKAIKLIIIVFAVLAMFTGLFVSCSSTDSVEKESPSDNSKLLTFAINKSFLVDSVGTRATAQPETRRVILNDGLLVDAILTDVGNSADTRSTTNYYDITKGKGMAFLCKTGTTAIVKQQEITVTDGKISVWVPVTDSYDIYFYLNEDENLSQSSFTIPASNSISDVVLATRPLGSKDDYAKATNISSSSTSIINSSSSLIFTPLGSEVKVTVQAGVTPITAFSTTLKGIQATGAKNVHVATGNYESAGAASNLTFSNDYDVVANRPIGVTSKYAALMSAKEDYQAFMSVKPSDKSTENTHNDDIHATLTILSLSGPTGSSDNETKTYSSNDTMTFTTTFRNGHRYNILLQLATPIYGYQKVDANGYATGTAAADNSGANGVMGKGTDDAPLYTPTYSSSATWPCLNGRNQYYEWDAKAYYPGTGNTPSATVNTNSYYKKSYATYNNWTNTWSGSQPTSGQAAYSCKYCPTLIETLWYLNAGVYWDKSSHWYCPNGFVDNNVTTGNHLNVKVHSGGCWLKQWSKMTTNSSYTEPGSGYTIGTTSGKTTSYTATTFANGKPGVDQIGGNSTTPNEWFFLPSTGGYAREDATTSTPGTIQSTTNLGGVSYYWLSTTYSDAANQWEMAVTSAQAVIEKRARSYGFCIWSKL